jgi:hypothetical protein
VLACFERRPVLGRYIKDIQDGGIERRGVDDLDLSMFFERHSRQDDLRATTSAHRHRRFYAAVAENVSLARKMLLRVIGDDG